MRSRARCSDVDVDMVGCWFEWNYPMLLLSGEEKGAEGQKREGGFGGMDLEKW